MFNSRNNDILFIEDKLLLPYCCESFEQKALENNSEISDDTYQLKLKDCYA